MKSIRLWDLPTGLFHWLLVLVIALPVAALAVWVANGALLPPPPPQPPDLGW